MQFSELVQTTVFLQRQATYILWICSYNCYLTSLRDHMPFIEQAQKLFTYAELAHTFVILLQWQSTYILCGPNWSGNIYISFEWVEDYK